jgi:hypothetical protein
VLGLRSFTLWLPWFTDQLLDRWHWRLFPV